MSQEGYLLITKPSFIEEVCQGWPRNRHDRPTPNAKRVKEVLRLLESAKPVCFELAMHPEDQWILDSARLVFSGWDLEEDPEETWCNFSQAFQCPILELSDEAFDTIYGDWDFPGEYRDKSARTAQGLKVYWVLWSY